MLRESATNVTELKVPRVWRVNYHCIPLFKEFQEDEDVWDMPVFHSIHFF